MLGLALVGDDLGENGNRDLRRRDGADVQADGRTDLRETVRVKALLLQHLEKPFCPAPGADHAEIGRFFTGEQHAEAVRVVAVTAGDDDDVVEGRDPQTADAVFKAVADNFGCIRETAAIGKIRTVVYHMNLKAALGSKLADRQGDVPAAEDDEPLARHNRFTDREEVAVIFGRHAGKASALRVHHGGDARNQAALQPIGDQAGFTPDDSLHRDGPGPGNLRENIGIEIGHDYQLLLYDHSSMIADRDILS